VVTNYVAVNGIIIGEEIVGAGRTDYATDALGSVTATLVSGTLQNTYAYKPYGGRLAKSGAGSDPDFAWVGLIGYKQTGRDYADVYVRARTYSSVTSRWATIDPMWPIEHAYGYAACSPQTFTDSSGMQYEHYSSYCKKMKKEVSDFCYNCRQKGGPKACMNKCNALVQAYDVECWPELNLPVSGVAVTSKSCKNKDCEEACTEFKPNFTPTNSYEWQQLYSYQLACIGCCQALFEWATAPTIGVGTELDPATLCAASCGGNSTGSVPPFQAYCAC